MKKYTINAEGSISCYGCGKSSVPGVWIIPVPADGKDWLCNACLAKRINTGVLVLSDPPPEAVTFPTPVADPNVEVEWA